MKLQITANESGASGLSEDTYVLPISWLKSKATHLYLASNVWDSLQIDLTDDVPIGFLPYLLQKVTGPKTCSILQDTSTTLNLLIELYPEQAGTFRRQFLCKKPLTEVLNGVS